MAFLKESLVASYWVIWNNFSTFNDVDVGFCDCTYFKKWAIEHLSSQVR